MHVTSAKGVKTTVNNAKINKSGLSLSHLNINLSAYQSSSTIIYINLGSTYDNNSFSQNKKFPHENNVVLNKSWDNYAILLIQIYISKFLW